MSTAIERPLPLTIVMACDDVRHTAYLGGYCAAKSPLGMEPLPLMVPKDPLRQSMDRVSITSDHTLFPIGLNATVMVDKHYYATCAFAILGTIRSANKTVHNRDKFC